MAWNIEATDEFKAEAEQISIGHKVDLLEMVGPVLGRPDVDSIKGSRFPHMKELRVQHSGTHIACFSPSIRARRESC
jgi:hypothetical protein